VNNFSLSVYSAPLVASSFTYRVLLIRSSYYIGLEYAFTLHNILYILLCGHY